MRCRPHSAFIIFPIRWELLGIWASFISYEKWFAPFGWEKFAVPPLGGATPPEGGTANFFVSKNCELMDEGCRDLV